MEYILQTNGLCKEYRHGKALDGLTMQVPKGSIYGLVGKNGAGKTTLIRIVCGPAKAHRRQFHPLRRALRRGRPLPCPPPGWARWWRLRPFTRN